MRVSQNLPFHISAVTVSSSPDNTQQGPIVTTVDINGNEDCGYKLPCTEQNLSQSQILGFWAFFIVF
jgi:hypothetical protein